MTPARAAALGLAALAAATACGDGSGPAPPQGSQFRALPTVLSGPALNVAVDGRTAITNLGFGQLSRTVVLTPGGHDIRFQPVVGTTAYDRPLTTTSAVNYTAFVIDSAAIATPIVLDDSAGVPAAGKGVLRVASYAAQSPLVDVYRSQPDSSGRLVVGTPFGFRSVSPYYASTPGKWTIVVSHHGVADTLLATDSILIAAGQARTVVLLDSVGARVSWRLVPDRN